MTTRKDFLAASALAAALPATAAAAPSPSPSFAAGQKRKPASDKLDFDQAAFNATLDVAAPHKHLFTSIKIDGAEVFGAMRNTIKAYAEIGTPMSDVHPVAVLYHGPAVALGFDDTVWNQYFLPLARKNEKSTDPEAKDFMSVIHAKTTGNPCLRRQGGEWDYSIPSLIADAGARFFICNNATHGYANYIATTLNLNNDDVYQTMSHHLIPNAMLVPAGVWAVHAIQEHHYTTLATSL